MYVGQYLVRDFLRPSAMHPFQDLIYSVQSPAAVYFADSNLCLPALLSTGVSLSGTASCSICQQCLSHSGESVAKHIQQLSTWSSAPAAVTTLLCHRDETVAKHIEQLSSWSFAPAAVTSPLL